MLVALCADKGAPGVTTTTLALSACWPRPSLIAEVDPAGSDLPYRMRGPGDEALAMTTGVMSLGLALRAAQGQSLVPHRQYLAGGTPVLVGPSSPEQAAALGPSWGLIGQALHQHPSADVLADCGRVLTESAPNAPILQHADAIIMVCRGTAEGVAHLRHGLATASRIINAGPAHHRAGGALQRLGVLVVTEPGLKAAKSAVDKEVHEVLQHTPGLSQIEVLGVLPADAKAAAGLSGLASVKLHKSKLFAACTPIAKTIAGRGAPLVAETERQGAGAADPFAPPVPHPAPRGSTPNPLAATSATGPGGSAASPAQQPSGDHRQEVTA